MTVNIWGLALQFSYDLGAEHFISVIFFNSAHFVVVALGLRHGAVWALRLFRILVSLGLAFVSANIVAGTLVVVGVMGFGTSKSRSGGEFALIASAIVLTLGVVLFRKMRRVRWLDPSSTPEEWETPMNRAARRPMSEYVVRERLKEKAKGRTR